MEKHGVEGHQLFTQRTVFTQRIVYRRHFCECLPHPHCTRSVAILSRYPVGERDVRSKDGMPRQTVARDMRWPREPWQRIEQPYRLARVKGRSARESWRLQNGAHDFLGLTHDGIQVRLVFEAFRIELVDVLGAGRPCRKPAARGHDF